MAFPLRLNDSSSDDQIIPPPLSFPLSLFSLFPLFSLLFLSLCVCRIRPHTQQVIPRREQKGSIWNQDVIVDEGHKRHAITIITIVITSVVLKRGRRTHIQPSQHSSTAGHITAVAVAAVLVIGVVDGGAACMRR